MDKNFWLEKWARNEIGFHEPNGNRLLQRWWPELAVPTGAVVLVPLCGKSPDMWWLRQRGYRVLGIELSEQAVQAFFQEYGLEPQTEQMDGFVRWSAEGIDILQGDLFELAAADRPIADALYDRAALIALPARDRPRYANVLRRCLSPKARGLLITLDYQPADEVGPPYSVAEQEVRELFGVLFSVGLLSREDVLAENPKFRERGRQELHEAAFALLPPT